MPCPAFWTNDLPINALTSSTAWRIIGNHLTNHGKRCSTTQVRPLVTSVNVLLICALFTSCLIASSKLAFAASYDSWYDLYFLSAVPAEFSDTSRFFLYLS